MYQQYSIPTYLKLEFEVGEVEARKLMFEELSEKLGVLPNSLWLYSTDILSVGIATTEQGVNAPVLRAPVPETEEVKND